jgi:hypothetical protein
MPKPGWRHSVAFYDAMVRTPIDAGFDFLKVDDQAGNITKYGRSCNAVAKATENQRALEGACALHTDGLINCMAHNATCIFHTRRSAVTRCSEDYARGDLGRARRHLHNSYTNMILLGYTVWGDHDMFHSNDDVAGMIMSRSKAMSGGPIYLSDNPEDFQSDKVWPLCDSDGRVYRPLAPATALPESLFIDPFAEVAPFRAVAPLPNDAAAVICYNLTEPEQPVEAWVSADDYADAAVLLQGRDWPEAPTEGFVLYDWDAGTADRITRAEKTLESFDDWLTLLCPVRDGWAVIGRPDKFLSPATVELLERSPEELLLRLPEPGAFRIWQKGPIACDGAKAEDLGDGLWELTPTAHGERDGLAVRVPG